MPTPVSHAAVGYALGVWSQRRLPISRVSVAAAICAALPDIDVLGAPYIAHRGITHSLLFVITVTALARLVFSPRKTWPLLGLALLSHSLLDALSTYSVGIAFFAPFSSARYRFLWTPLGDPQGRLVHQLEQEVFLVLLPALLAIGLGLRARRTR